MSKPRLFVGSSVEGLDLAYAVQQNLAHTTEVTVWPQGVFLLSHTNIESLAKAVETQDFGVFVFSPDDEITMRGEARQSVRDNVLFELGLFIGALGRNRVFIIIPDNIDMHIPTDLIGMSPVKYESGRTDNNLQAATGSACNSIRSQIKTEGLYRQRVELASAQESVIDQKQSDSHWMNHFFDEKYDDARRLLEGLAAEQSGEKLIATLVWTRYCELKINPSLGLEHVEEIAIKNMTSVAALTSVAAVFDFERQPDRAIQLLESADSTVAENDALLIALSGYYQEVGELDKALAALEPERHVKSPTLAVRAAEILKKEKRYDDALAVAYSCYRDNSSNEQLRVVIAEIADETDAHDVALYLLSTLVNDFPKKVTYWGRLGNACLNLGLPDRALVAYRRAESLVDNAVPAWITANIGNIISNQGFPSESKKYFLISLSDEPDSQYAHDRLAGALKKIEGVDLLYDEHKTAGLKRLRQYGQPKTVPPGVLSSILTGGGL